jgi:hypothetical protein
VIDPSHIASNRPSNKRFRSPQLAACAVACALWLCACEVRNPVTVAVYPGAERCSILEKELPCAGAGRYLRDTLKIEAGRQIDVSMFQMDKSHDRKDVERVAASLRNAGFTDVREWHFNF